MFGPLKKTRRTQQQERNLQSALDLMYQRRQFQIDLERDFHLRNQIMLEQQIQQRAEVALAQQQHELLLSSPTFARHRQQLHQIEASLLHQITSPGMLNNNDNQSLTNFAPAGKSEISNESSPPAAQSHPKSPRYEENVIESLTGAASSSERGPRLYESIADILEKMKRNEAEHKISQVRTETFLPQAMGSYVAVEKLAETPHEEVVLDSGVEETHKPVSSTALFSGDEKERCVVDIPTSDQKQAPDEINAGHAIGLPENGNMRSPADEERPVHDTRNIDFLIATLQRSPLAASLSDAPFDSSPNVDQPSLPTITEADSSSEVRPPPDARLFQLIQQLDHELGQTNSSDALPENDMSNSPVEGDSEEEYSEDRSQEDAVPDEFMGSVEDENDTSTSYQVISAAPLVLSKNDPWWPTTKQIMRERKLRASRRQHQSKNPAIPPLSKRLKLNPEVSNILRFIFLKSSIAGKY